MDASAFRRPDSGYVVRAYEGHLEPELRLPYVPSFPPIPSRITPSCGQARWMSP